MPIEVDAPDGSVAEFPDGTPPEVIKQAMAKRFGGPTGMRAPQEVVFGDTGQPVGNDAQAQTYRQLNAVDAIDRTKPLGDARNPYGQRGDDISALKPNDFYIDRQGRVLQAPVSSKQVSGSEFGVEENAGYLNQKGAALFGYALNPSEKSRVDWIAKQYPGAQFTRDETGRLAVKPNAEADWMYLNAPGFSATDLGDVATQTALFAPANSAAKAGAGLARNAARVGAASTGISVAQDVLTGQPIDPGKAVLAGAGGAAGEYIGAGVGALSRAGVSAAQRGTQAVKSALSGQAMPIDQLASQLGSAYAQRATNATAGNPSRIRMSLGEQTGDFSQIAFEQAAKRRARGQEAGDIMQAFAEGQASDVSEVGRGLAGSTSLPNVQKAGEFVQEGLRGREALAKDARDAAYDAIKESNAAIEVPTIQELPGRLKTALEAEFFSPEVMTSLNPRVKMIFGEIDRLANSAPVEPGARVTLPLAAIGRVQQGINSAMMGAQGSDKAALQVLKREFGGWLQDTVDNELMLGDPNALDLLKRAPRLHAELRRLYGGGKSMDGAQRIVSKLIDSGSNETDAVNLLFGNAELKGTGASVGALKNIREIVGDGPEWQALKEGAVMRLMSRMERNAPGGVNNINYKALGDDWAKALDGPAAPLMRELFTREEIGAMRGFVSDLRKIAPPEGTVNRSNTGYELSRAVGDATQALFGKLKILAPITKAMDDAANVGRAKRAVSGRIVQPVTRTPGAGSFGAAIGNELGSPDAQFVYQPVN